MNMKSQDLRKEWNEMRRRRRTLVIDEDRIRKVAFEYKKEIGRK